MKKNNARFLTTTLAAASLLASSPSYALGIGEMELKSALNQTLKAEIGLILADGENVSDFKVNLAPNEKFEEAGIPWSLFLSKVKFKIAQKNGKSIIELTSNEALKEPFLDFLIEVKSAKGNLYREFTVLIDPPAAYQAQTPAPITDSSFESVHFIESSPKQNASTYLTRENESLWRIAAQFNKQNNVSVPRMVSAIFAANPNVFQNSSEHTLQPNKTLTIPSFSQSPELFVVLVDKSAPKRAPVKKVAKPKIEKRTITTEKSLAKAEPKANAPTVKVVDKTSSEDAQKRVVELEKQLAEMQKSLAKKELEMTASKTPAPSVTSLVMPPLAVAVESVTPVAAPISNTLPLMQSTSQPNQTVAVLPPPTLPPVTTPIVPPPVSAPVVENPIAQEVAELTTTVNNYFGQDMYYYLVGGASSLLLGILGLLRSREQRNKKSIAAENVTEQAQTENSSSASLFKDSADSMFDESFDMSDLDDSLFEDAASGFADMVNDEDAEKRRIDDVLYKADVYCTYGNNEEAEKLLKTEFLKQPNAHDYALRLLKLYQTQDNKVDFKNFVFELVTLGKQEESDFWGRVSSISAEFYPEALFFMPLSQQEISDENSTSTNQMFADMNIEIKFDDDVDFNSMPFDDLDETEIVFGELSVDETMKAAVGDDIFDEPTLDFALEIPEAEITGFTLGESLDFTKTEEKKEEQMLDFNFADFAVEQPVKLEKVSEDPALEFDFGSFTLDEEPVKTEAIEDLDFGSFAVEEPVKTEAVADLNFGSFAVEEPVKTEAIEGLDFGSFTIENQEVETEAEKALREKREENEFVLDFAINSFQIEEPVVTTQPFAESISKRELGFDAVNDLLEQRINDSYLELTKIHAKEDDHGAYLDMSDSQFADSLASEVLKKCEIKEQLCRQKIIKEVLSKLS
jgi:pilus assembly protein FimV